MKVHFYRLALLLALALRAAAQVSVEVGLEQEQFLPGEPLEVAVKISNRTGATLQFGPVPEWLTVRIEGDGNYMEEVSAELPPGEGFSLQSPRMATKRINVEPYFNLTKPGRYKLSVRLHLPGFDHPIASPTKQLDIITGNKLWEQEFGLPGTGQPPQVRCYLLQQANYLKHLQLYLRITDPREQRPLHVVRLGQMVGFGQPTAFLDRQNDLHVLFQNGARSFRYCVLTPDGKLNVRQTYAMSDTRPRLAVDEEGAIAIRGGMRAKAQDDLPPDPEPDFLRPPPLPVPVPPPGATNTASPPS